MGWSTPGFFLNMFFIHHGRLVPVMGHNGCPMYRLLCNFVQNHDDWILFPCPLWTVVVLLTRTGLSEGGLCNWCRVLAFKPACIFGFLQVMMYIGSQRQRQPCMPHWAACFRHRGEIVKLHPIYINTCKTPKIQAGLNAKVRHQLQRPPMKVNSSSGKNL